MDAQTPRAHGFDTAEARIYLADFLADPTFDFVDDTFEFDADDPAEAADALLAAELVASAIGRGSKALPDDVREAIKKTRGPAKKVIVRARAAVRSALEPASAIRKQWADTGVDDAVPLISDLLERLT